MEPDTLALSKIWPAHPLFRRGFISCNRLKNPAGSRLNSFFQLYRNVRFVDFLFASIPAFGCGVFAHYAAGFKGAIGG